MSIIILGDTVPTKSNELFFKNDNLKEIIDSKILDIIAKAEYKICNLETPLIKEETPIKKQGPNLGASIESIKGLNSLNIDLYNLANNHIYDHGEKGLLTTIQSLKNINVNYIGVKQNSDIRFYHQFNFKGKKIGVYGCCENEFSYDEKLHAGANVFDSYYTFDEIETLKKQNDYFIVLFHGGKEEYRYPTPTLQKTCRKLVEKGADIVLCQHSHCIGSEEKYKGANILYGQGNFIFDRKNNEYWNTSLIIEVDIIENKIIINYIPIVKNGNGINLLNGEKRNQIIKEFKERNKIVKDSEKVKEEYEKMIKKKGNSFLESLRGFSKIQKGINRYIVKNKMIDKIYNEKYMLNLLNKIECETHREMLIKILETRLDD